MTEAKWNFAPTGGGIQGGFSDALQELFDTDREKFIARETIQNSLDAQDDLDRPVVVKFRRSFIYPDQIPQMDQLEAVMRRCYEFPPNDQTKARNFFSKALLLLKQKKLSILSIEDYNTIGITGNDYDYDDRWYRLIKSEGVVAQSSNAGGGSFGVGKGAPFVASALRTVLYSTWDKDNNVAFQGVSRLTSFLDEDDITRQRVGFYGTNQTSGVQDSLAVRKYEQIPENFRRNEKGTNIIVLGYEPRSGDWRKNLLLDILQNCWAAVYKEQLEVHLIEEGYDPIIITKNTLEELIYSNQDDFKDPQNNPKYYYHAMAKSDLAPIKGNLSIIGNVTLYLSFDEDGPKTIQWMRAPKIVVKPKKYSSISIKFSGVFICEDKDGNMILRDMEPADHRDWIPSKIDAGRAVISEINNWIINRVNEFIPDQEETIMQIPDLGDYLSDEEDLPLLAGDSQNNDDTNQEPDSASGLEQPKVSEPEVKPIDQTTKKTITIFPAAPGEKKKKINIGKKRVIKPVIPNPNRFDPNEDGPEKIIDTSVLSFRSFQTDTGIYELIVKSEENVSGSIILNASGEEGEFSLPIESVINKVNNETVNHNGSRIDNLELSDDNPMHLVLTLKNRGRYKLTIKDKD